MVRKPRKKDTFFNKSRMAYSALQGSCALAIVILAYLFMLQRHLPEGAIRTFAFITLILVNISMILTDIATSQSVIRTILKPNTALKIIIGIVCTALILILLFPGSRKLFQFELFPPQYILLLVAIFMVTLVLFELLKRFYLRRRSRA